MRRARQKAERAEQTAGAGVKPEGSVAITLSYFTPFLLTAIANQFTKLRGTSP